MTYSTYLSRFIDDTVADSHTLKVDVNGVGSTSGRERGNRREKRVSASEEEMGGSALSQKVINIHFLLGIELSLILQVNLLVNNLFGNPWNVHASVAFSSDVHRHALELREHLLSGSGGVERKIRCRQ